jgi:DNA invertase Pin-like site-specific DNA recombinase
LTECAAIYARVSTEDQDLSGQEREVRDYAAVHGLDVVAAYREKVSATGQVERREYARLWEDARSPDRTWNHLVVWSLDRWSREEKLSRAFAALEELENRGIKFHSVKEPFLDTDAPGIGRDILRALLPIVASFESRRRSERVRLALGEIKQGRRKTRSGRPLGRPVKITFEKAKLASRYRGDGLPWNQVAVRVGLTAETCRRAVWLLKTGRMGVQNPARSEGSNSPTGSGSS